MTGEEVEDSLVREDPGEGEVLLVAEVGVLFEVLRPHQLVRAVPLKLVVNGAQVQQEQDFSL